MAQRGLDLRKLFVKVKLENTDDKGESGNPAFNTTDIAYLRR